ncbi:MAG: peptidylprolyl isomerase [Deltaproteobacteria bacterium]|nr:peptidylprolyl isomerase [Deltaproteobacteria bacterium]
MGRLRTPFNPHQHSRHSLVIRLVTITTCLVIIPLSFLTINSPSARAKQAHESQPAGRILLDRLVAEVGSEEPIFHSTIQTKITKGPRIRVNPFPASPSDTAYKQALQDEINWRLIRAYAAKIELQISDEVLEEHLQRICDQYHLSREQLKYEVEKEGKSFDEYLKDMKAQLLFMRFQGRVIMPLVKLTDKDVESYYLKQHSHGEHGSVLLSLRQIVVSLPRDSGAVRRARVDYAQEIYKKLSGGMSFTEAEKLHSGQDKVDDATEFKLNDLNSTIRDAVSSLEKGQFTKPIEIEDQVYIFFLEDKKTGVDSEFRKNSEKKKQITYELRQKELGRQLTSWLKEERLRNKIRILKD